MYIASVEVASVPLRRRWRVRPRRSLVRERSSGGPPIAFARFAKDSAACRTRRRRQARGKLAADAADTTSAWYPWRVR